MTSYRHAPLSIGHDYGDPPPFFHLFHSGARHIYRYISSLFSSTQADSGKRGRRKAAPWQPKSLLSLSTALILIWMLAIWLGEQGVFQRKIKNCDWQQWERWPESATPHHMVLIADPQLVDPHTYPGRPWPLSTITRLHTDYYMRKSFALLQRHLDPTTVFFLGDLFDGGREWLPPGSVSSDPRWRNYGEDYWVKEYRRFGSIFFDNWLRRRDAGGAGFDDHRRILAGLPGNHDLGLGKGIRLPVRQRFNAFFGDGNHVDVVGNHTFVSVDTVSLSAKGQVDPATGRQGAAEGAGSGQEIWGPVEEFLTNLKTDKPRIINRTVRIQNARVENDLMFHEVVDINSTLVNKSVHSAYTSKVHLPSILLSHVPLYRPKDTPCGPLRERFPPSTTPNEAGEYLDKDPPNAIRVEAGLQYQNVLTPEVSSELVEMIGDVEYAFSGDDHDYCELVHRGYTSPREGGIREITVKSFSWAMGVRRPGFLLVSLWNPLDDRERVASYPGESHGRFLRHKTVQTQLCLLPDQLAVFIKYAWLLGVTLLAVFVRAVVRSGSGNARVSVVKSSSYGNGNGHVLPLAAKTTKFEGLHTHIRDSSTVTAHNGHSSSKALASRVPASGRTAKSWGYGYPTAYPANAGNGNGYAALHDDDPLDERWSEVGGGVDMDGDGDGGGKKRKEGVGAWVRGVGRDWVGGVVVVGVPVGVWWGWVVGRY